MEQKIIGLGILLIFIGVFLLIIGSLIGVVRGNNKSNVAVGGFIGPISFGFFSSKSMFWIWLLIMVCMVVFWLILRNLN